MAGEALYPVLDLPQQEIPTFATREVLLVGVVRYLMIILSEFMVLMKVSGNDLNTLITTFQSNILLAFD